MNFSSLGKYFLLTASVCVLFSFPQQSYAGEDVAATKAVQKSDNVADTEKKAGDISEENISQGGNQENIKENEEENYGYELNVLKKSDMEVLSKEYGEITKIFSNYRLFWAEKRLAGRQLVAQYTPKNVDPENWTHLLSLIHEEIPEKYKDNTAEYIMKYAGAITSVIQSNGVMLNSTFRKGNVKNMSYLDYMIGKGKDKEHVLSLVWSQVPGYISNIQYIKRGKPHEEADYKAFYAIMTKVMNMKIEKANEKIKKFNEEIKKKENKQKEKSEEKVENRELE